MGNGRYMEVTVALEARYSITPDGSAWSQSGLARKFWERYLTVFDRVIVFGRTEQVLREPQGSLLVNSAEIVVHPLPNYVGPLQYMNTFRRLRSTIRSGLPGRGAVILRAPSIIGTCVEHEMNLRRRPYALEVIGDPQDVFAPGAVTHPLRPLFRWQFVRALRRQCLGACGVSYVTRKALQQRYPAQNMTAGVSDVQIPKDAVCRRTLSTYYSSIELDSSGFRSELRNPKRSGPFKIAMVGSLAQLYKGPDILIEAVARCLKNGLDLFADIVGDGQYRLALTAHAERIGLAKRIRFVGQVTPGAPVRRFLDSADLFVLPSRTEGLPRALIEAMARGLPCIASAVGGIPELLAEEDMTPPGDPDALALKIQEVLANPSRMAEMSHRNWTTAQDYVESALAERRRMFYEHVREQTLHWETQNLR
jgi:glycosyltransferase involved in cell wall biosynthesis